MHGWTYDMCIFMFAWPRASGICYWKGLVRWLGILGDPMGYQSPWAPTNLPSKSLDEKWSGFLISYSSHPSKIIPPVDGQHILHQFFPGETTNQFMAKIYHINQWRGWIVHLSMMYFSTSFCVVFRWGPSWRVVTPQALELQISGCWARWLVTYHRGSGTGEVSGLWFVDFSWGMEGLNKSLKFIDFQMMDYVKI